MTALALASIIHPRSHLPNEKLYLSSVGEWIRSPLTSTAMTMTPMTRDIGCSVGSVSSPGMTTPLIHVDGSYVCVVGINFSNHVVIIWHRGKAKIDRLLGNAPPETCTAPEPTCRFPSEIVDMMSSTSPKISTLSKRAHWPSAPDISPLSSTSGIPSPLGARATVNIMRSRSHSLSCTN